MQVLLIFKVGKVGLKGYKIRKNNGYFSWC
jgi:hypothetical protein